MSISEDIGKMEREINELKEENETLKNKSSSFIKPVISSRDYVTALTAVDTKNMPEGYQKAQFDMKRFEWIFKQLTAFDKDSFILWVKNDYPAILMEEKDSNVGLVIAPRVEAE